MTELNAMGGMGAAGPAGMNMPVNVQMQAPQAEAGDSQLFRDSMDRQMAAHDLPDRVPGAGASSEKTPAGRLAGLATEFQKDQQYVSKLLEQATRTGDSVHLMRAMLALSDYQIRVQTMAKTVAKVAGAVDQLTKLQ